MVSKNVYHMYIWMEREKERREISVSSYTQSVRRFCHMMDRDRFPHTKFSYSNKKLCNSAKHVLGGRRLRIISYRELTFMGSGIWE